VQDASLNRRDIILLSAIVVGAAVFRFIHIGQESLWLDEGVSAGIARLPWSDFSKLMWRREGNMVLYYLLLHGWMKLGTSEAWLRALSAVFSIATVPFIYLIGREVRSRATGLIGALLFALSPFAIAYAQEARSYSLVCFLLTTASWCLLRREWKWWAATMALAGYAHLFAVLVLAAHLLYLGLLKVPLSQWRKSAIWLAVSLAPAGLFVVLKSAGQLNWIPPLTIAQMKAGFGEFAGGGDLALAIFFLSVLGAVITWRGPVRENRTLFIWLWLLLPIGIIVGVSLVHPLLISRFLVISLPALLLAAAFALSDVPKPVSALLLLAIVFFSIRTVVLGWRTPTKDDWRSATAYVLSKSSPQDGIVFHQALGRQPFEYYAARLHAKNDPLVISPARGSRLTYRDFEGDPEEKLAVKIQNAPSVLWVVLNRNEPRGESDEYTKLLLAKTKAQYENCASDDFKGVSVIRCQR
jgi:uncharacterized membrane protein